MSRTETARVVCNPAELLEMKTAASVTGISLSAWMRQVCLDAARGQSVVTQNITAATLDNSDTTQTDQLNQLKLQVSQLSQTITYIQQQLAKLEDKVSQDQPSQVSRVAIAPPQAGSWESANCPVGSVLSCEDFLTYMGWRKTTISNKTKAQLLTRALNSEHNHAAA